MESLRLEKTLKIIESNRKYNTAKYSPKLCSYTPRLHIF